MNIIASNPSINPTITIQMNSIIYGYCSMGKFGHFEVSFFVQCTSNSEYFEDKSDYNTIHDL